MNFLKVRKMKWVGLLGMYALRRFDMKILKKIPRHLDDVIFQRSYFRRRPYIPVY